ncbi:MAG: hypothetical protein Kow0068_05580 [Marinilabiliales bacterium]
MKKHFIIILIVLVIIATSCLTVEKKTYTFNINKDGSVTLTIDYYNIISTEDDEKDVSLTDFSSLISDYYEGDKLNNDYPEGEIVEKKLFEKDGVLCGKVVINFPNTDMANIRQYKDQGPLMYYLGSFSETYETSNGEYMGTGFPVIFWDEKEKNLTFSTIVTTDLSTAHSLLSYYKTWKENSN